MSYIFYFNQNKPRLLSTALRALGTSAHLSANHYDVLGITPKANQADIKSAYYKLSKLYHPDKSKDEESEKKFRAITEAYEILGNVGLKKLYDKGVLVGKENTSRMEYRPDPEPTDPSLKFYKSRIIRHAAPTMDGKTPIYDFDTWSKEHYGNILKKNEQTKRAVKTREQNRKLQSEAGQEMSVYFIFAVVFMFVSLSMYGKQEYDNNKITQIKQLSEKTEG